MRKIHSKISRELRRDLWRLSMKRFFFSRLGIYATFKSYLNSFFLSSFFRTSRAITSTSQKVFRLLLSPSSGFFFRSNEYVKIINHRRGSFFLLLKSEAYHHQHTRRTGKVMKSCVGKNQCGNF
jgi:hypothetical protein